MVLIVRIEKLDFSIFFLKSMQSALISIICKISSLDFYIFKTTSKTKDVILVKNSQRGKVK